MDLPRSRRIPQLARGRLTVAQIAPVAIVTVSFALQAWQQGSILARHWLPHAVVAALLLAALLVSGGSTRPRGIALAALAFLVGLAIWTAISLAWSPVPSLARDEALLTAWYAIALAVPLVAIRADDSRVAAAAVVVAAAAALALATASTLAFGAGVADLFFEGRLNAPVRYPNALAALWLLPFWPAIALAAERAGAALVRLLALGAAVSLLAGWLLTQSKGGLFALAVSALLFFAVAPGRIRSLVPTAVAGGLVLSAYPLLTAPYATRDAETVEISAIHDAGRAWLVASAAGALAGLAYVLVDRRFELRVRRPGIVAAVVLVAVLIGAGTALAGSDVSVGRARDFASEKWEALKSPIPANERSQTHFESLGSNRYDFWRVAATEFERHPVAGIGGRAFGPAYLEKGRSGETPTRAHSVWLDALSETGIVGFLLLVGAAGLLAVALARRAVGNLLMAGIFGAFTYFLGHASVDAVWTFPVVGVPAFLLAGLALSRRRDDRLPARAGLAAGIAVAIVTLAAFVPPWLSAKYTERLEFDTARRLDPLSVEPLVAESRVTPSTRRRIELLRDAVEREPRTSSLYYLLGVAYRDAGRRADAQKALLEARALNPDEPAIVDALHDLRGD